MSSVRSFVLDYGLPGLAMVGAGLVTFMLTGGPEEFPSADPDEGLIEQDEDNDQNYESNEADDAVLSGAASMPPKWAEELSERSSRMAEELRLLKEASQAQIELQQRQFAELMHSRTHLCGSCRADLTTAEKTTTSSNENCANDESETDSTKDSTVERREWTEEDWMQNLRAAVWWMAAQDGAALSTEVEPCDCASLLHSAQQCIAQSTALTEASAASATATAEKQAEAVDLAPACELLVMYINNILKNPSVPRYRRISTTNSSYMKSLLPVEAQAVRVLHAVGFVKKAESTYYEYAWHSLPAAAAAAVTITAESSSSDGGKVSTSEEGTTTSGSNSDRVPGSAEVAATLLHAAVSLLSALKTSRSALAEGLVQQLTASSATSTTTSTESNAAVESVGTSGGTQTESAGEKVAVLSATVPTTSATSTTFGAVPGAGEEGLIAVMEVSEEGAGLLGGGSAQDDGVDFMKILKKAQESKWKPA